MERFYLGVDASKGYADFTILDSNEQTVMANFQLDDTPAGHEQLYKLLGAFSKEHSDCRLYAGIESTGGYENNWFHCLLGFRDPLNLKAARLNPCGVSNNSKAGLKRMGTDKISAHGVAQYLIDHPEKVNYTYQDQTAGLRKRYKVINMLIKQKGQLLNHLESMLYAAHPQLMIYFSNDTPKWILALLKKYPSAVRLARAKAKSVAQIPFITKARAEELIADAKKSVASCCDPDTEEAIKLTVGHIQHLQKTEETQKKKLATDCSLPEVELLKSFKGISDYSAIGLMLEIQNISRFVSAKKLAAFFGVHPMYKESGDKTGRMRMSKMGRKEPRRILYMVALSAIGCNPLIRDFYEKQLEKGMVKMAAVGACMHKILRIVYGMLVNNSPFDPRIDEANQQKRKPAKNKIKKDRNRRYQEIDPKAPVSRRQGLKRRGNGSQSQSDGVTKCGITAPVSTNDSNPNTTG